MSVVVVLYRERYIGSRDEREPARSDPFRMLYRNCGRTVLPEGVAVTEAESGAQPVET